MTGWKQKRWLPVVFAGLTLLISSCGGGSGNNQQSAATGGTTGAANSQLPPGHPPTGAQTAVNPPPPGSGTGEMGLTWTKPDGWVAEQSTSPMRKAQFRIPGPGGDAELTVFYFGPGQGGDPMANAKRWASQFSQPGGGSSEDAMKTSQTKVGDLPVTLVEVAGTYTNRMVSNESFADYELLGAIAEGPDANWFFKMTGPKATVEDQRGSFTDFIHSLHPGK